MNLSHALNLVTKHSNSLPTQIEVTPDVISLFWWYTHLWYWCYSAANLIAALEN